MDSPPTKSSPPVKPLDYAPVRSAGDRFRSWLPAADQLATFLKNMIVVVPLTLLIWVYAEREQSVISPPTIFPIEVKTIAPDRIVVLRYPAEGNVVVELSGPRARIDEVRTQLLVRHDSAAGQNAGSVQLLIDPQFGTGGQELEAVPLLNRLPLFKNNGITVKSCQPSYIKVDIDQLEERDAVIRPAPAVAKLIENATFTPRTIKLRAPRQLLDKADGEKKKELVVWADLAKREELRTRTGSVELKNVPLFWTVEDNAIRENVTFSSPVVDANLTVKTADIQFTIPSVTIFKETPANLDDRYIITYTPVISNVTVTGPAEQIDTIRKGDFKSKARLEISSLDPVNKPVKKRLSFDLPPGVTLTKETAERAGDWEFTMRDR